MMGTDQYYLYKHSEDTAYSFGDLSSLSGTKVAIIQGSISVSLSNQWMQEHGVDLELMFYDSVDAQEAAFNNGEVDLIVQNSNSVLRSNGFTPIADLGSIASYLTVSPSRPDLLDTLNHAQSLMISVDPFLLQNLQYTHYGTAMTEKTLTADEQAWIDGHSTLVVGYLDNYLPYCNQDDQGQATGLLTDVLS